MNILELVIGEINPISVFNTVMIIVVFGVIPIIAMWKIFEKADKPGWAVLIPIYREIVFVEIINKPMWWVVMLLIPGINIIWMIWTWNLLVKKFGKTESFTVGVILLSFVFIPILGFGKSKFNNKSLNI